MRMIITLKMKKISLFLVLACLCIIVSLNAFAIAESETEFLTYDDKEMAFTILEINDDGTIDVMISEPIPINAKSLDVGDSQQYYSNWECFVATLVEVEGDDSDVYVSKCHEEDDVIDDLIPIENDVVVIVEDVVEDLVDDEVEVNITTEDLIDFDTEEAPLIEVSPSESFFDKEVKMGNVLVAVLIMLIIVMVVMLSVIIYLKNNL